LSIDSRDEIGFNDHGDVAFLAEFGNLFDPLQPLNDGIFYYDRNSDELTIGIEESSSFSSIPGQTTSSSFGSFSGVALNNAGEFTFRALNRFSQRTQFPPPIGGSFSIDIDRVQIAKQQLGQPLDVQAALNYINDVPTGSEIGGVELSPFSGGGATPFQISEAEIDNAGNVAFFAAHSDGAGSGLFTQDDLLINFADPVHGMTVTSFSNIAMNDVGDVAISAEFSGLARSIVTKDEILVSGNDVIDGVAVVLPSNVRFDINNNNDVVFAQADGIFNQNALLIEHGVTTIGGFTITDTLLARTPTFLNNDGTFVFKGLFDTTPSGGHGIFTQHGLVAKRGDFILGQTVNSLGSASINERGDIVFFANFFGGTDAIILATLVPEPGSFALAACSFGLLVPIFVWRAARRRPNSSAS